MALPLTPMFAAALLCGAGIRPAAAQDVPTFKPPRGDAGAYLGWFGSNKSELDGYDDWYKGVWHGSVGAGYYWTENLKSELDFGSTSRGEIYEVPRPTDPLVSPAVVDHEFRTTRLTLGQHYQFFHNAFFHPTIGGGIALTWETTEREFAPVFVRDPLPPGSGGQIPVIRQVTPARAEGPETRLRTMAFAATGFKAYFATRGFFRSDLRVMFTNRVEDVTVRLGFGVDF